MRLHRHAVQVELTCLLVIHPRLCKIWVVERNSKVTWTMVTWNPGVPRLPGLRWTWECPGGPLFPVAEAVDAVNASLQVVPGA